MNWILKRLSEQSTWRGIILLATGLGVSIEPEKGEAIIALGLAAVGLINIIRKEQQATTPGGEFNPKAEVRRAEPVRTQGRGRFGLIAFFLISALAQQAMAVPQKVVCSECRKSGVKSTVQLICSWSTAVGWTAVSYNESGKAIYHADPNRTAYEFRCSNGHNFKITE